MKVGIITLYGTFNYGNRLQNYALSKTISSMGHDVTTLVGAHRVSAVREQGKRLLERREGRIRIRPRADRMRDKTFQQFNRKYIPMSIMRTSDGSLPLDLGNQYDVFVVGSDQVWNPLWWGSESGCAEATNYLLRFAPPSKRVAYSASFGLRELPPTWNDEFRKQLSLFTRISMREESGSLLVEKLTGLLPPVTLDPTMLLSADAWRQVVDGPKPCGRYALVFNLGEKTAEQEALVSKLSEKRYRIIEMMDPSCPFYSLSPAGFLSIVDRASCVVTDSYHATIFSILFGKPFAVFDRKHRNGSDMSSRIDTLLSMLGLSHRRTIRSVDELLSPPDDSIDGILEGLRRTSMYILTESLSDAYEGGD